MHITLDSDGGMTCQTHYNGEDFSFELDSLDHWWRGDDGSIRLHVYDHPGEIVLDDSESRLFKNLLVGPDPNRPMLGCVRAGRHYFNLLRISSFVFDRGLVAVFLQSRQNPVLLNPEESKLFVSAMNGRHYTILTALLCTEDDDQ